MLFRMIRYYLVVWVVQSGFKKIQWEDFVFDKVSLKGIEVFVLEEFVVCEISFFNVGGEVSLYKNEEFFFCQFWYYFVNF